MVSWKTSVNPVYIQEHDVFNQLCIYDTMTGQYQMQNRQDVENPDDLWIGVAKQNNMDVMGLFATDHGPVFFMNEKMYPLNDNEWDFIIEHEDEKNNIFRFVYNEKVIYETKYKRVTELDVHPYADEEFMDFYTWMAKKKMSKTFIEYYTTK